VDLNLPVLPMSRHPSPGASAAVIGYPENGGLTIAPARFGSTQSVISDDSYGRGPVTRQMSSIRGSIRSGNSGGPVVDMNGRVLATVFAATATGKPGGFAIPDNLVRRALRNSSSPVGTGACTAG
jgi:S1-C subfamily serine protease